MLNAATLEDARTQLQAKGLRILQLKPPPGDAGSGVHRTEGPKPSPPPGKPPGTPTRSTPKVAAPPPPAPPPPPARSAPPPRAPARNATKFLYQGVDRSGRPKDGLLLAVSLEEARRQLEERQLKVLILKPADGSSVQTSEPAPDPPRAVPLPEPVAPPRAVPSRRDAVPEASPRLSLRQLNLLAIQLSVMMNAGLSYFRALSALSEAEDLATAHVANQLAQRIHDGYSLSRAMASMPGTFDDFFVRMVKVGETTGNMHQVLHMLTDALTRQEKQRSRVMGALAYPAFILAASGLMVAFLVYYMLPGYLTLFAQTGVETPFFTRALIWLSRSPIPLVGIGLPLGALGLLYASAPRLEASRRALDYLRFHTPGIKLWFRKALLIRICRNLALMTSTGIGLHDGLQILTSPSTGFPAMDRALLSARDGITNGDSLADSLGAQPAEIIPPFLVQAVAGGEQIGKVPHFLEKWADMLEEDLDYTIDSFIQMLEPIMLLVMGVIVGFVVLAAFMPVFTLIRTL